MGNQFTGEQKVLYGEYQKTMQQAASQPSQFDSLIAKPLSDLAGQKK